MTRNGQMDWSLDAREGTRRCTKTALLVSPNPLSTQREAIPFLQGTHSARSNSFSQYMYPLSSSKWADCVGRRQAKATLTSRAALLAPAAYYCTHRHMGKRCVACWNSNR
jgi:hypothetical protein